MADLTRLSPPPMNLEFEGRDGFAWREYLFDVYRLIRFFHHGKGSPEGVVVAPIGHIYVDEEGGAGTTLYIKEADGGLSTGWSTTA